MTVDLSKNRPCIYNYLSYSEYLEEFRKYKSSLDPNFTLSKLKSQLGLSTRTQIKKIIKGQVTLSKEMMENICKAFELSNSESHFFDLLRKYHHAKNTEAAVVVHRKIIDTRNKYIGPTQPHVLEEKQLKVLEDWYNIPILHYFELRDCTSDLLDIVKVFKGKVTIEEVSNSLEKLISIQLLERDPAGQIRKVHGALMLLDHLPRVLVRKYHKMMIQRALDSVEGMPTDKRFLLAGTLTVRTENMPEIQEKMSNFLTKLVDEYSVSNGNAIYQMNMQLFSMISVNDNL